MAIVEARGIRSAIVDREALVENARALVAARGDDVFVDVRADGYGHGALTAALAAADAGVGGVVVWSHDAAIELRSGLFSGAILIDGGAERMLLTVDSATAVPLPFDVARDAELALYGVGSGRAALRVAASVVATKKVAAGAGVSYGHTWRASTPTLLGLVGMGYADGVHRHAGNAAVVCVADKPHPIVGRVAMNAFVIDLGVDTSVEPGAEAVIVGDPRAGEPTATEWAGSLGVPVGEVLAALGNHTPRSLR